MTTPQEDVNTGFGGWRAIGGFLGNFGNRWLDHAYPERVEVVYPQTPTPGYPTNPSNPAVGDPNVVPQTIAGFKTTHVLIAGGVLLGIVVLGKVL